MARNGTRPEGVPTVTIEDATARLKAARNKPTTVQLVVGLASKWRKYGPAAVVVIGLLLAAWRYVEGIKEDVQWIRSTMERAATAK